MGSSAIEIGKLLGATVIAAASTEEKLQICKKIGADYTINYTTENLKLRYVTWDCTPCFCLAALLL